MTKLGFFFLNTLLLIVFVTETDSLNSKKFNLSIPWDARISALMNDADVKSLQVDVEHDYNTASLVRNTCAQIRNEAVRSLSTSHTDGWYVKDRQPFLAEINNLCFGSGFSMFAGKIVQTGACAGSQSYYTKKQAFYPTHPSHYGKGNRTNNDKTCLTAHSFYVVRPKEVKNYTDINSVKDRRIHKDRLNYYKDMFRFSERQRASSNADVNNYSLLTYTNNDLNYGYSMNAQPLDNKNPARDYNHALFDGNAYPNSPKNNKFTSRDEEVHALQVPAEEKTRSGDDLVSMTLPRWFCPVVCAGLNTEELKPVKPVNPNMRVVRVRGLTNNENNETAVNLNGSEQDGQASDVEDNFYRKLRFKSQNQNQNQNQNREFKPIKRTTIYPPKIIHFDVMEENQAVNESTATMDEEDTKYIDSSLDTKQCAGLLPDAHSCLKYGEQLSNWFMQRNLNPGHICNYDSGHCDSLFSY